MADHGDPPRLEVRGLRPDERRLAGGLVARAMRDNPTTLAMCGADPFDRLAHMQPIWTAFFHRPPGPAVGAFHRGCLVGVAGATPPGACVGSTYGPRAAQVAGGPEPPPVTRAAPTTCRRRTRSTTCRSRTGTSGRWRWSPGSRAGASARGWYAS